MGRSDGAGLMNAASKVAEFLAVTNRDADDDLTFYYADKLALQEPAKLGLKT